jgi:hypothetical protein
MGFFSQAENHLLAQSPRFQEESKVGPIAIEYAEQ